MADSAASVGLLRQIFDTLCRLGALPRDSGAEDGDIDVITTRGGYTFGLVAQQETSKPVSRTSCTRRWS